MIYTNESMRAKFEQLLFRKRQQQFEENRVLVEDTDDVHNVFLADLPEEDVWHRSFSNCSSIRLNFIYILTSAINLIFRVLINFQN